MQHLPIFPSLQSIVSILELRAEIRRRLEVMDRLGLAGTQCQKPALQGKTGCRLHGGLSPYGADHWNYQHGNCTKKSRKQVVEVNSYVKQLELLAMRLGMIEPKRRKRNAMICKRRPAPLLLQFEEVCNIG